MTTSPSASASAVFRRSFAVTNLFLRKQLWVWPLLAATLLAAIGYWLRTQVERSLRDSMAGQLQAILDADVAALRVWLESQRSNAETAAASRTRLALIEQLILLAGRDETTAVELIHAPQAAELKASLKPWMDAQGYVDFIVTDGERRIVASGQDQLVGQRELKRYAEYLNAALGGQAVVSRPFPSVVMLTDEHGELRSNVPTMFAAAPVRDEAGAVIGVLAFRLRPEQDFTRILNIARFGTSGETYAFDRGGVLLSQSRFDDDIKAFGLLPDTKDAHSILTLELRDPQVDLTAGERPKLRRSEQPLTHLVAEAVAGRSGVDVDGYRDYRGVPSIGAWTWLPEYDFGVATEIDQAEAYRPTYLLRLAFWGLFALLAAAALAIFIFTVLVARMRHALRKAAVEAKTLGQYTLEEKLGAGGMGIVYRGRHALLRRPTAIKLLDVEKTTPETIRRFEREVQLTSQLNHANTIAVYDYGSTPEGVFYYAMEYLEGINLEQLVEQFGPQPEGRVIRILVQVCGSLNEAHSVGLIHRDIKPGNIVLTRRGGVPDFVKVLDFGLVKAVGVDREAGVTTAGSITGTPLYLAPEAIQHPDELDARGDLYAVGAVGYYLLTGTTVFRGQSIVELMMHQVNTPPEPPSSRLGKPISADLEAAILRSLAKNRDERPATARQLADALLASSAAGTWTDADAHAWWDAHRPVRSVGDVKGSPSTHAPADTRTAIWTSNPSS